MANEVTTATAYNEKNEKVHINDVARRTKSNPGTEKYHCAVCEGELIPRKGGERKWYFCHKTACTDTWKREKGPWHIAWQKRFPDDAQETVFDNNGVRHRADVTYKDYVIEFQYSKIAPEDFNDRNDFYNAANHTVVWLFDVHGNNPIKETLDGFHWSHPFEALKDFQCDIRPVYIFFEFEINGDRQIRKLKRFSWPYQKLEFDEDPAVTFTGDNYREAFRAMFDDQQHPFICSHPGAFQPIKDGSTIYRIIAERPNEKTICVLDRSASTLILIQDPMIQLQQTGLLIGLAHQGNAQGWVQLNCCEYPFWTYVDLSRIQQITQPMHTPAPSAQGNRRSMPAQGGTRIDRELAAFIGRQTYSYTPYKNTSHKPHKQSGRKGKKR